MRISPRDSSRPWRVVNITLRRLDAIDHMNVPLTASVDLVPPVAAPLPHGLADPRPVVGVGTVAWFTAAVILLLVGGPSVWVWACVTGGLLGLLGFAMMHAQRTAARRGGRSAQQGLP
jgi:hypothetical protein